MACVVGFKAAKSGHSAASPARERWQKFCRVKAPSSAVYVLLIESLCTTDRRNGGVAGDFVDRFSFCAQSPVLQVFYQCEQKMTNAVFVPQWPWILDPLEIHQQSYPQAVKILCTFGQQQEITRGQRGVAECAEAYDVSPFVEENGSIKIQPKLQWSSEQSAQ